jgi:hypothetical protein
VLRCLGLGGLLSRGTGMGVCGEMRRSVQSNVFLTENVEDSGG